MRPLPIAALERPFDQTVPVPGSRSQSNRALLAAALATGRSRLDNVLVADDVEAMTDVVVALGAGLHNDDGAISVDGTAGAIVASGSLNTRQSGTTTRFAAPVVATTPGPWRLDGDVQMRARPMGDLFTALEALGATVTREAFDQDLPATISGPIRGGRVSVSGATSSQFLSGLLLAAPLIPGGLEVHVSGELVSRPYVEMTTAVMRRFGAIVEDVDGAYVVADIGYRAAEFSVEPDAASASYLFAAAALTGSHVVVPGLGSTTRQGDFGFITLLSEMGARVEVHPTSTTVEGTGTLSGIEADLRDLSDMVPTLAVVATCASGRTVIRGVENVRVKESDRIGGLAAQLRKIGAEVVELRDGLEIVPGPLRPALIDTAGDHRMAMAFGVLGLVVDGIEIDDPECVGKTFPSYYSLLEGLRR